MKKLSLFLIILLLNLTAFSQSATKPSTDSLRLPTRVAQAALVDLYEGDKAKLKVVELEDNVKILNNNSSVKDNIIRNRNGQIELYKGLREGDALKLGIKDEQVGMWKTKATELAKELKRMKRSQLFERILSGAAIVAGVFFLLK